MIQDTVAASKMFVLVMVKDVPAVRAETYDEPILVNVPPWTVKNIREFAVTFVVFTVIVPLEVDSALCCA